MGYVSIFQFGILDGYILRYAKYDYEDLDKPLVRSQFFVLIAMEIAFSILGLLVSLFYLNGAYRTIGVLISVGLITKNAYTYTSYLFQSTNRIYHYAKAVMIQRLGYALFIVVLLVLGVQNFVWFCVAELFGDTMAVAYGFLGNKELYFSKGKVSLKNAAIEARKNISVGFLMMLAGISSAFLILGAKTVIQWRWDEWVFGKVSFAFSLYGAFCSFIVAVGVVLFPSLKRMDVEALPNIFHKVRKELTLLFFILLLFYYPLYFIVGFWLPNYQESLDYFSILFPIVLFYSKVHLLTNNYLKIYGKEKWIFIFNFSVVLIGLVAYLCCAYLLNSLLAILLSVVVLSIIRSVVSELVVMKIIGKVKIADFIVEFIMTAIFIVAARHSIFWAGIGLYVIALAVYIVMHWKIVIGLIKKLKGDRVKKEKNGIE